jgi:hypothetical protein
MSLASTAAELEPDRYPAIDDMINHGQLVEADAGSLPACLDAPGMTVLFFAGGAKRRRESHDVAVALREVLKAYGSLVHGVLLRDDGAGALKERFRVVVEPSLVFVLGGETLEVVPGVRDWADYAGAFRRYLGEPGRQTSETRP